MSTKRSDIIICKDRFDAGHRAALLFIELAEKSIDKRGRFSVALAGGSSPREIYNLLPTEIFRNNLDSNLLHFFWGDERDVPKNDKSSNFCMANETFLNELQLPKDNIHRIKPELGAKAAEAYENDLRLFFQLQKDQYPRFDLIFLGIGEDGHTASLFPRSSALTESKKLVSSVSMKNMNRRRITLTPLVLTRAFHIIFFVCGLEKVEAVREVIKGKYNPDMFPAQIVTNNGSKISWFLDEEAASLLKGS